MTNAPDNNEYQKKLNKVNLNRLTRCAVNMQMPQASLTPMQIVFQATLEGMIILRAEEKEKSKPEPFAQKPQILETKLGSISNNPIIRARVKILNGYTPFRRAEIERMEKIGDTDNRFYKDFAAEVSHLTDIP
jgi:hypothetical protein